MAIQSLRAEPFVHRRVDKPVHLEVAATRAPLKLASAVDSVLTPGTQEQGKQPALVLRVLTGVQMGSQAPVRYHRVLVGNLESECDVVLDVGHTEKHACLVRVGKDGWTVLSVAGDLWVGDAWVEPQQTRDLVSGDVLTLGEVSFCLANTATVDWERVQVPSQREASKAASRLAAPAGAARRAVGGPGKAAPGGTRNVSPSAASHEGSRPPASESGSRWLLGLLLLVGLIMAAAAAYWGFTGQGKPQPPVVLPDLVTQTKGALAGVSWSRELTLQPDPHHPRRILLAGYLPERARASALEAALQREGIEAEHRWVAIDEVKTDLSRRLGLVEDASDVLRYTGQGRFLMEESAANASRFDPLVRRAIQDTSAVRAIDVQLRDQPRESASVDEGIDGGSPLVIQYVRADGAPDGVSVKGLELLQPLRKWSFDVREVRLGGLPSVVLSDGARYFEGSTLPGGAVLTKIQARHLLLQIGAATHRLEVSAGALTQKKPVPRRPPDDGNPGFSLS